MRNITPDRRGGDRVSKLKDSARMEKKDKKKKELEQERDALTARVSQLEAQLQEKV